MSVESPSRRRVWQPEQTSRRLVLCLIVLPVLFVILIFGWLFLRPHVWYWTYSPREGDVLFQSLPHGALTNAIEGSTHSPWSHCGIVARANDEWIVYEAYGQVQSVPLKEFWSRSRDFQFAVYRFTDECSDRIPAVLETVEKNYIGLPYDAKYELDDEKIYCSELIYKAFRDVTGETMGTLDRLGDLNWQPYERTIRELEGGEPPLDRMMITPRGLSDAKQLERIKHFNVE